MLTGLTQDFTLNNNRITGSVPVALKYLGSSCTGCNGLLTSGFKLHNNHLCGGLPSEVEDVGTGWATGSFKVKPRTFISTTPCDQTKALVATATLALASAPLGRVASRAAAAAAVAVAAVAAAAVAAAAAGSIAAAAAAAPLAAAAALAAAALIKFFDGLAPADFYLGDGCIGFIRRYEKNSPVNRPLKNSC